MKILSSIPNQITLARIASVPLFMFLVLSETTIGTILATVLFSLAAISDAVDGYLARSLKQTSTFGKFADPIADKLLVAGALIAFVQLGELTAAPVMVIIAREFLVTGLRILLSRKGRSLRQALWESSRPSPTSGLSSRCSSTATFSWGALERRRRTRSSTLPSPLPSSLVGSTSTVPGACSRKSGRRWP